MVLAIYHSLAATHLGQIFENYVKKITFITSFPNSSNFLSHTILHIILKLKNDVLS